MKKLFLNITAALLIVLLACLAEAGTIGITISATVVSKSNCKFNTTTSALNFGNLDPALASDVTRTTSLTFRCIGSAPVATFFITTDNGTNPSPLGVKQMAGPQGLPYTLTLSPASGTVPKLPVTDQTLTITGTVRGVDYGNALPGAYADSVVVSIIP